VSFYMASLSPCRCRATSGDERFARRVWFRVPEHDRRISRGDDFAGDAWQHFGTGAIRWCVVGVKPGDNPLLHSAR